MTQLITLVLMLLSAAHMNGIYKLQDENQQRIVFDNQMEEHILVYQVEGYHPTYRQWQDGELLSACEFFDTCAKATSMEIQSVMVWLDIIGYLFYDTQIWDMVQFGDAHLYEDGSFYISGCFAYELCDNTER